MISVDRALSPSERVVHILDGIMSLNFPAIVRVKGPLDLSALGVALDKLLAQHPLLATTVVEGRAPRVRTLPAARVPIRLVEEHDSWIAEAEREIAEGWPSERPRVRMVVIRHARDLHTLLLTLHHPISDGQSSLLALRDLFAFLAEPGREPVAQATAPLDAYLPARARGWQGLVASARFWWPQMAREARLTPPHRVVPHTATAAGTVRILPIEIDADTTARFLKRTRTQGATLHGALCALLLRAYARTFTDGSRRVQCKHPIDMRPLLGPDLGERRRDLDSSVGYFVSAIETAHAVVPEAPFWELAREVSTRIMQGKHRGEPFDFLPVGNLATALLRAVLPRKQFARLVEKDLLKSTLAFSSAGELSALAPRNGPLEIEAVHFAAGPSIVAPLAGSSTVYRGRLRLNVTHREPLLPASEVAQFVDDVELELRKAA
jgi:hypothetical protein